MAENFSFEYSDPPLIHDQEASLERARSIEERIFATPFSVEEMLLVIRDEVEYLLDFNPSLKLLCVATEKDRDLFISEIMELVEKELISISDKTDQDALDADILSIKTFLAELLHIDETDNASAIDRFGEERLKRVAKIIPIDVSIEDVFEKDALERKFSVLRDLSAMDLAGTDIDGFIKSIDPDFLADCSKEAVLYGYLKLNDTGRHNCALFSKLSRYSLYPGMVGFAALNDMPTDFLQRLIQLKSEDRVKIDGFFSLQNVLDIQESVSLEDLESMASVFSGTQIDLDTADLIGIPFEVSKLNENARKIVNTLLKQIPCFDWKTHIDALNDMPTVDDIRLKCIGLIPDSRAIRTISRPEFVIESIRRSFELSSQGIDVLALILQDRLFENWADFIDVINATGVEKTPLLEFILNKHDIAASEMIFGIRDVSANSFTAVQFAMESFGCSPSSISSKQVLSWCKKLSGMEIDENWFKDVIARIDGSRMNESGGLEDFFHWVAFAWSGTGNFATLYDCGLITHSTQSSELYDKIRIGMFDPVADYEKIDSLKSSMGHFLWKSISNMSELGARNFKQLRNYTYDSIDITVAINTEIGLSDIERVRDYYQKSGLKIELNAVPIFLRMDEDAFSGLMHLYKTFPVSLPMSLQFEDFSRMSSEDVSVLTRLSEEGCVAGWHDAGVVRDRMDFFHTLDQSYENVQVFDSALRTVHNLGLRNQDTLTSFMLRHVPENIFVSYVSECTEQDRETSQFKYLFSTYAGMRSTKDFPRAKVPASLSAWRMLEEFSKEGDLHDPESVGELLRNIDRSVEHRLEGIKRTDMSHIPKGLRVSIGTELEIMMNGLSRSKEVSREEIMDFKRVQQKQNDPRLAIFAEEFINDVRPRIASAKTKYRSEVALATRLGVGVGNDGVHEFANVATDDYRYLLWEFSELGKLGFIDFDRKLIQWIEKGMHITLSGDGLGIVLDGNAMLLQTALSVTGWSTSALDGIGATEVVNQVDSDSTKLYKQTKGPILQRVSLRDNVFNEGTSKYGVENRLIRLNSFEHLARTLRSFHRLGIALKSYQQNRHRMNEYDLEMMMHRVSEQGDTSLENAVLNKELQNYLKECGVPTLREAMLIIAWAGFKQKTVSNFESLQSSKGMYKLNNPMYSYDDRDITRLGAEIFETFQSHDDKGEMLDDALLSYHQKALSGSLADAERQLVIQMRSLVEKILR